MELVMSEKISTAFALSLASGVIIMMPWLFFTNFQTSPMGWMMSEGGMMSLWTGPGFAGGWYLVLPLVSGIIVLAGAIMMKVRPQEIRISGIIVLVFSVIGFAGMGFSILGSILGIIGGAIALSVREKIIMNTGQSKTGQRNEL
jgi:hypothetical protein